MLFDYSHGKPSDMMWLGALREPRPSSDHGEATGVSTTITPTSTATATSRDHCSIVLSNNMYNYKLEIENVFERKNKNTKKIRIKRGKKLE